MKIVGDYAIKEMIGKGSFSQVYKGVHRQTGQIVAVKCINYDMLLNNEKNRVNLQSEINIMKDLSDSNVLQLRESYQIDSQHIYLILEYCPGGDLAQALRRNNGPFSETMAQRLLHGIAKGLRALHQQNLIHRDLKPQNILLTHSSVEQSTVKLCDFGFAKYVQPNGMIETLCGSPLYMAPEILRFEPYDARADLWSVGVILYELVCGRTPFPAANSMELLKAIERNEFHVPSRICLSRDCMDLLSRLLQRDFQKRITFQEFFEHPFVRSSLSSEQVYGESFGEEDFVFVGESPNSGHAYATSISYGDNRTSSPTSLQHSLYEPSLEECKLLLALEYNSHIDELIVLLYLMDHLRSDLEKDGNVMESESYEMYGRCLSKCLNIRETMEMENVQYGHYEDEQISGKNLSNVCTRYGLEYCDRSIVDEGCEQVESAIDGYKICILLLSIGNTRKGFNPITELIHQLSARVKELGVS